MQEYEYKGCRNTPEFLSKHYQISSEDISVRMKTY